MNRVVITGIGTLASVGNGIDEFWASLKSGKSGITGVTRFDCSDIASKVASEITDFNPEEFMDPKEVRRNDRYAHLALAATHYALADANLSPERSLCRKGRACWWVRALVEWKPSRSK